MDNLEHNIKEAFARHDANAKVANKEAMWNRLDHALHKRKGVAAFWRVAAIFLAFLIASGVFAAINMNAKHNREMEQSTTDYKLLEASLDSLKAIPMEPETVVQVVEKEKVIYRDRIVYKDRLDNERDWKQEYVRLTDSMNHALANQEKSYQIELERLENELAITKMEVLNKSAIKTRNKNQQSTPFELKSERIELDIQKKPAVKTSEMEMKVFHKNFIENKNNLNTTLFKK
jgi:hypothetical protein